MNSTMSSFPSGIQSGIAALPSSSSSTTFQDGNLSNHKMLGVLLAVLSALLTGTSFVVKKRGILSCTKVYSHSPIPSSEDDDLSLPLETEVDNISNNISNNIGNKNSAPSLLGLRIEEVMNSSSLITQREPCIVIPPSPSTLSVHSDTSTLNLQPKQQHQLQCRDNEEGELQESSSSQSFLTSPVWWIGLIMMLTGELFNVAAYMYAPAVVVTPLGSLSVVITAILSDLLLSETLTSLGWIGCFECLVGSLLLVLNTPEGGGVETFSQFWTLFCSPVFLSYLSCTILLLFLLLTVFIPKYSKVSPLPFLGICSIFGGFVVVCLQVLGSTALYTIQNYPNGNQFTLTSGFIFVLAFFIISGPIQINYLNKALNEFNTAVVTPIYFVMFTTATLVSSGMLFQDFHFESSWQFMNAVLGVMVLVSGVMHLGRGKSSSGNSGGDVRCKIYGDDEEGRLNYDVEVIDCTSLEQQRIPIEFMHRGSIGLGIVEYESYELDDCSLSSSKTTLL